MTQQPTTDPLAAFIVDPLPGHRSPYLEEGGTAAELAHRSADMDREELHTLSHDDPRRDALLCSAERWEQQALELGRWQELERRLADMLHVVASAADRAGDLTRSRAASGSGRLTGTTMATLKNFLEQQRHFEGQEVALRQVLQFLPQVMRNA